MLLLRTAATALALTLALLVSSPVRALGTLYVATGSKGAAGVLYAVDPLTAAFTMVAPITTAAGAIGMTGLAFDPSSGTLYGVTGFESPNSPRNLVTLDPATGAATVIGALTGDFGSTAITDISFLSDGTLFGLSQDRLYTVDLATGALTSIGVTGQNTPGGGLAFDSVGSLFTAGPATGSVDRLDPSTGARSGGPALTNAPYGAPLGAMMALAFSSSDVLFAANSAREQNGATVTSVHLVTIDGFTGFVTDVGALPGNVDALAFGPAVPEPSSLALLGAGAVIAVLLERRSRR